MTMNAGVTQPGGMPPPGYAVGPSTTMVGQPCPQCGVPSAGNLTCANCRQVYALPVGVTLASPGKRLGAYLLSGLLGVVTLYIGWLIWDIVLNSKGSGQSPGKQLLKVRVIDLQTGRPATFGKMFLRGLLKDVIGHIIYGILALFLLIDKDNQELWDKAVSTVVIDDPNNSYAPDNLPPPAYIGAPMPPPMTGAPYAAPPAAPYQPGAYQAGSSQPAPEAAPPPPGPQSPPGSPPA